MLGPAAPRPDAPTPARRPAPPARALQGRAHTRAAVALLAVGALGASLGAAGVGAPGSRADAAGEVVDLTRGSFAAERARAEAISRGAQREALADEEQGVREERAQDAAALVAEQQRLEAEAAAAAAAEAARLAEEAARRAALDAAIADPRSVARVLAAERGWAGDQFGCLERLWTRESGWKHTADNPTSSAYGIPQALPGHKMSSAGADWETNPTTQITWGLGYIADVYGTPCGAWAKSQSVGWY